jgi:transposase
MLREDWVRLTKGQRAAIRHRLRRAGLAAERRLLNAVALYDAGQNMEEIAETLGCSLGSISLDMKRWRAERFTGLAAKPCGGSEPKVSEEQFAALEVALEVPPSEVGYCAGTQTP